MILGNPCSSSVDLSELAERSLANMLIHADAFAVHNDDDRIVLFSGFSTVVIGERYLDWISCCLTEKLLQMDFGLSAVGPRCFSGRPVSLRSWRILTGVCTVLLAFSRQMFCFCRPCLFDGLTTEGARTNYLHWDCQFLLWRQRFVCDDCRT